MELQPWGSLPKSQIDNQLISEAISEAIAVHEADPTSHMGVGESIDMHRQNEVIDHPQSSIVPDKWNSYQKFNFPILTTGTIDTPDNCLAASGATNLQIYQNTGQSGDGQIFLFNIDPAEEGYNDGDIVVDFKFVLSGGTGTRQGRFDFGFAGFEMKAGYHRFRWFTTSWQYSAWIADTLAWNRHLRVFYSAIDNTIYFFVNGSQAYSVEQSPSFEGDLMDFFIFINRGTSTSAKVWLYNLSYYLSS